MVGESGFIGYVASSTAVSVVADIAESLDISGFTPEIVVSSIPALAVSSMVLDTPMAVSGTLEVSSSNLRADLGNLSGVLNTIDADTGSIQADLGNLSGV